MRSAQQDLARVFRAESGRVLATLIQQCRDIDLAEDALQDALLQATEQWRSANVPKNKGAWLLTVARRRLIDRIRRISHQQKEQTINTINASLYQDNQNTESEQLIPDERLKLIFTCCHPALAEESRVALTLKTLCGLTSREIARAFLATEISMNQRLTRAKRKIRDSGIAYKIPHDHELADRLPSVLAVIYLIYNESYSAYEGQNLTRTDLANEAIRLARVLYHLLPRSDVAGLLALMLFHQARNAARSSPGQNFIPLEQQDRSRWDAIAIKEARSLLLTAMAIGKPDKYQIQAAISALHSEADTWAATDWKQIQLLYQRLYCLEPSAVVALNLAMVVAHQGNYQAAFEQLNHLQTELKTYQPFYAARADVAAKLKLNKQAITDYQQAIDMSKNSIERDFLVCQKDKLPLN